MATIRDVAARAGVSVATVSRVLNQSGYADAETRARVLKAASDLSYRQNVHWSRLRRQSSRTILFLLANRETINSFHMRLLASCERALQARGYDLVFSRYEYAGRPKAAELPLPRLLEHSGAVDGVLAAGVHHPNLLTVLDRRKVPYALLGNDLESGAALQQRNCVFFDDSAGVADATAHLIRLGHRRIAFVGNMERSWFRRRYAGYAETMRRHGFPERIIGENWPVTNPDYGQMAASRLLALPDPPTAILAGNDEIAAGAWKELTRRDVSIPREISLIGCGDRTEFAILEPELTSISVFVDALGESLTAMLLRRIEDPRAPQASESYPCKLIERASAGPCPAGPVRLPRAAGV